MRILKRALLGLFFLITLAFFLLYLRLRKESYAVPDIYPMTYSKTLQQPQKWTVGSFQIQWQPNENEAYMRIVHTDDKQHTVWQSVPGKSWVAAAKGQSHIEESRGSFFVKDKIKDRCERQHIDAIQQTKTALLIRGTLACIVNTKRIPYVLRWNQISPKQLQFTLTIQNKEYNRSYLQYASSTHEHIFGFGEQFTYFDLKGKRVPILIMEQGIGRGAQPITWGADLMARSGGDWHTSYASVPHYITSQMRSLFLENSEYAVFDLRPKTYVQIGLFSHQMKGRVLFGKTPLSLIETYTTYSGRMRKLPDWVHKGAIIGMQGGTKKVKSILQKLQKQQAPIAAFWLQDWVGQRKTSFGKQLWWNWTLDKTHYPQWPQLVDSIKQAGGRVLLYINPFLADVSKKPGKTRNLFKEAEKKGLLAKTPDNKTYMIRNTSFSAAILDLTNPKARTWIQQVIQKEMIKIGASGWMADFGEAMPFDAKLHKGNPATVHNRYPEMWARINKSSIQPYKNKDDFVFFMRAGFTRSPGASTLFWLGDQLVSWDQYDGIKTAVTGLLSGGISGYSLNHSDIGGYTTITHPIRNYHRSKELHMRWAELSAFTTVYRTHEGNQPGKNHQFHSSPETFKHFVRFAKIYRAWAPLRKQLVAEASQKGYPVARHPFLHYPKDSRFYHMHHAQFMLGPNWMVVPVLDPNKTKTKVYLPVGKWRHIWTGKIFGSDRGGMNFTIPTPIGQPALFYKVGDPHGMLFRKVLREQNLLK
jgi:alpha-glucosidase